MMSNSQVFFDVFDRRGEHCYELNFIPWRAKEQFGDKSYFSAVAQTDDSIWSIRTQAYPESTRKDVFLEQTCIDTGHILMQKTLFSTPNSTTCIPKLQNWVRTYGQQSRVFFEWRKQEPYLCFSSRLPYVRPIRRKYRIPLAAVVDGLL